MENSLSDLRSHSGMVIAMDMIFGILCGVGLFFLLIQFLKNDPVSPPPGREGSTPEVKKRQRKTRKRTAAGKGGPLPSYGETVPSALPLSEESHDESHASEGMRCRAPEGRGGCWAANQNQGNSPGCRHCRKNVEETQNRAWPVEISTKHPLLNSTPHHFWNADEKLDLLPLSQLLSCLRVLENLIQQKFNQILWNMSSVLSESVVATAWISKKCSSVGLKTVRFSDTCGSFPALPLAQGPPQLSQEQSLPHQPVTPSLGGMTDIQELDNLPSATRNLTSSSSQSRTSRRACLITETKIRAEDQPRQQGLDRKETIDYNVPKWQAATSQPTDNLSRGPPPSKDITSASILPESCQDLQHQEDKETKTREQFLPSRKLMQLQGQFPAHNPCESKKRPDLSQPSRPSILNCKSRKLSQMMESVPSGMPLKRDPGKCNIHHPIKVDLSAGAKDLPCTSCSTPGKGLEPRNPAIRTDNLSYVNTTQNLSFLDPKTQMKLESNVKQIPAKHLKQYLQAPESKDRIPASPLPQPAFPSSHTCASKAEYYSKAAMILENLHHRDPGGTRVETLSVARLQSPLSAPSEVTQRASPPAPNHSPSKANPDTEQRYLSAKTRALCFQAKGKPIKTIRGTGRGSLKPTTNPRMTKHAPWKRFENVTSGHPCWSGTVVGPQECVSPPLAKQTSRLDVKEKTHPSWNVNLGSSEIPNGQAINFNLRDLEYVETNRIPGHFQTPALQHSGDLVLTPQAWSENDFRSSRQPEARLVGRCPDGPSLMHPTTVSMPSQQLLPNPKTSQGLGNIFTRRDQRVETEELVVPEDNMHKVFHPNEERKSIMRARDICQEERLGTVRSSTPSSIQLKNTAMADSQSSLNIAGGRQSPETYVKKIARSVVQCVNVSTKFKGQGDCPKSKSPLPSTVQTENAVTRERLFCTMVAEAQSLMHVVIQILMKWLNLNAEDPSKIQWCDTEPLVSQMGGSYHSCEGHYNPKSSQPEKRSYDNTIPKRHIHPLQYCRLRDRHQSGVGAQTACDQRQNRVKRGMGFDQLPTPKENNSPCRYRGIEDRQQLGTGTKTPCGPDQVRMKSGTRCYPHRSSKEHNYPIKYREIGNKYQGGVVQKAYRPCQSTKKGMGCGHPISLKENKSPVTYRATKGKEQSGIAAQRACDPRQTFPA